MVLPHYNRNVVGHDDRVDHETGRLPRNFWEDVAAAMNGSGDDDDTALQVVIAEEDEQYEEIMSINLQQFDFMTATAIRNSILFQNLPILNYSFLYSSIGIILKSFCFC